MDIRQLRYFVGILEAKSLSKASTLLHVAQPALSTQIRNLEHELGVKLLHRHTHGITPTNAGERLAQHAYQLLRQIDRMRLDLSGHGAALSGGVLICVARSIPGIVTTAIMERCRRELPDIQLRIVESWRQQMQADRLAADLVLTFHPQEGPFYREPLVQDELVFVYAVDARQGLPEIDLSEVFQRALILPSRPHCLRQLVEATARSMGHELRIACEVDSFEVTKELVARNVAEALLPVACVREDVKKKKLQLAKIRNPRLRRTLYVLHSSRQVSPSAIDLVCRVVREVILECADRETFGWRRMPLIAPPLYADRLDDHENSAPSSGDQPTTHWPEVRLI